MKEVEKTSRPFRYDLNQIPYDYIVEVMNRFKGLDLVDKVSEELWTEVHNIVQKVVTKPLPRKQTGYSKHPLSTTQEKTLHMDITRWSILKAD